jgi:thiamine biosynthesis lipoprotein
MPKKVGQMKITRRHFLTSLGALAQGFYTKVAAASARSLLSRFEFSEPHMGTMIKIVLYAPDHGGATAASRAAFDRIAALDHIMSDYDDGSELMQLCRAAGGPPLSISQDLWRVMATAQDLSAKSDGAFDITVGPVVQLWRRARRRHELPEPERLAAACALVGYQNVILDARRRTARLLKPGMRLDLGGIAKGDAADQALIVLRRNRIPIALVAAAGDIAAAGPPQDRTCWRIGIEAFESPSNPPSESVGIHNSGVSTSGDSEQHLEIGGLRYSHIINPKTGMALTGRRCATVTAPDDISADCYATALCVMGPERGFELIAKLPGGAALMMEDEAGQIRRRQTPGFPALIPLNNSAGAEAQ